jgi:hypothetical protein
MRESLACDFQLRQKTQFWPDEGCPDGYVVRDANGARAFFRCSSWRASAAAIWSHSLLCSSRRDRSKGLAAFFANCARCSAFE